jgi:hypothetical protein
MAVAEPYDILADWPGWQTTFDPVERGDISRQKNGVTRTRLGPMPIWMMRVASKSLSANEHDALKGLVQRLAGLQTVILGYSLTRVWPQAYPKGTWPTGGAFDGISAELHTIDANNRAIRVTDLPGAFALKVGDMVQIGGGDLHRVQEAATASGGGLTPLFEIYPPLWTGAATGQAVSVKRPHCRMRIVPGSVAAPMDMATGRGTVSFDAMEARDA